MIARPKPGPFRPVSLSPLGGRFAAFLQILALLLILASPLLPAIAPFLTAHLEDGECRGDHRLCGCAPARIASNTCCCARTAIPSCCVVSGQEKSDDRPSSREGHENHAISTLPCGGGEPATFAAGDPWLPAPTGPDIVATTGFDDYLIAVQAATPSPSLQPDVPPPRPATPF